jgi:hypothetical protein
MHLEGKAWHRVIGLVREDGPPDPPLAGRPERRERRSAHEVMHEGGRENGFAGSREPRDSEA